MEEQLRRLLEPIIRNAAEAAGRAQGQAAKDDIKRAVTTVADATLRPSIKRAVVASAVVAGVGVLAFVLAVRRR